MATKNAKRRYRCRLCLEEGKRPYVGKHPQQVLAHRIKAHGERWPTSKVGKNSKTVSDIPMKKRRSKRGGPRESSGYADIARKALSLYPTSMLLREIAARVGQGQPT